MATYPIITAKTRLQAVTQRDRLRGRLTCTAYPNDINDPLNPSHPRAEPSEPHGARTGRGYTGMLDFWAKEYKVTDWHTNTHAHKHTRWMLYTCYAPH